MFSLLFCKWLWNYSSKFHSFYSMMFIFKRCQSFTNDTSLSFLTDNTQVRCWTSQHIFWSLLLGIPLILTWGIILPLIIFIKLFKSYKNPNEKRTNLTRSIFFSGLNPKFRYWYYKNPFDFIFIK